MPEIKHLLPFKQGHLLTYATLFLLFASTTTSLFFNGQIFIWYAISLSLLITAMAATLIQLYHFGIARTHVWLTALMLLYWLYLGMTVIYNPVQYLGIMFFWWLGVFPLAYLITRAQNQTEIFWNSLFMLMVILGVLLSIFAVYQVIQFEHAPSGTFLTKNSLAAFLNLLIFPLLSITLIYIVTGKPKPRFHNLTYPAVGCFIFILAIINSRGAWLAFIIGMLVFITTSLTSGQLKNSNRQFWVTLASLIVIPIALAEGFKLIYPTDAMDIASRLSTLYDPSAAGQSRFVIWQPAWTLFLEQPFKGIGLGTYFLKIRPYLHPDDTSAHFYVHNDYLQLALEGGVAAFILFLAILIYICWHFYRAWLRHRFNENFLYVSGLFCSILALGIHSFFTFNLFLLPTMMVAGILVARFDYLTSFIHEEHNPDITVYFYLKQFMSVRIFYFLLVIVTVSLWVYFTAQWYSIYQIREARYQSHQSKLEQAHLSYKRAQKAYPVFDMPYYADADLLRLSANLIKNNASVRNDMYLEAESLLKYARKLNPLRPEIVYIQGKVYEQLYPDKKNEILNLYTQALNIDPLFVPARLANAEYLITLDKFDQAYSVLAAGIGYNYQGFPKDFVSYLTLFHKMAEQRGDEILTRKLKNKLDNYVEKYNKNKMQKKETQ